jgi:hypothetical protein
MTYKGGAGVKRTMVTAIECISADGRSLHPLTISPASTHRSNWSTHATPGWHYGFSENGYNDSKIILGWLTRVFDPQTRAIANAKPRMLISDGFIAISRIRSLRGLLFEDHSVINASRPSLEKPPSSATLITSAIKSKRSLYLSISCPMMIMMMVRRLRLPQVAFPSLSWSFDRTLPRTLM